MAYSTIIKPSDYFNTKLYTGNTPGQSITGIGFKPDFSWFKGRVGGGFDNSLRDVLRGSLQNISSNSTAAENTSANSVLSFDTDGFTLGTDNQSFVNENGTTYVAWNWKANGAGSANTDGSITSTVSANTTSGFSIVTYTGNSTAGATIGHGLGVAPKFIIVKSYSDNYNWTVYYGDPTDYLVLNATDATTDSNEVWNDTAPSSTVFTVGNRNSTNQNTATFVAYCFAEKTGFSKFGSYEGNGSTDGPFVYTGFKPAFVMIKVTNGTDNWFIFDNRRSTSGGNVVDDYLYPNLSNAEGGTDILDFLSNGFKLRTTDGGQNGSSNYIYMAFAESPFTANVDGGLPTTAR